MHREDSQPGRGHVLKNRAHSMSAEVWRCLADQKDSSPYQSSTTLTRGQYQSIGYVFEVHQTELMEQDSTSVIGSNVKNNSSQRIGLRNSPLLVRGGEVRSDRFSKRTITTQTTFSRPYGLYIEMERYAGAAQLPPVEVYRQLIRHRKIHEAVRSSAAANCRAPKTEVIQWTLTCCTSMQLQQPTCWVSRRMLQILVVRGLLYTV